MTSRPVSDVHPEEGIVGRSVTFQSVLNQVRMIAKSDSTTLIQGETGSQTVNSPRF